MDSHAKIEALPGFSTRHPCLGLLRHRPPPSPHGSSTCPAGQDQRRERVGGGFPGLARHDAH
eukprot:352617-Rhodomonas_salina.1